MEGRGRWGRWGGEGRRERVRRSESGRKRKGREMEDGIWRKRDQKERDSRRMSRMRLAAGEREEEEERKRGVLTEPGGLGDEGQEESESGEPGFGPREIGRAHV